MSVLTIIDHDGEIMRLVNTVSACDCVCYLTESYWTAAYAASLSLSCPWA